MNSGLITTPQDLSLANVAESSLRLREITLPDQIKSLKEIARALLTELESLGSPATPATKRELSLNDEVRQFEIALIRTALVRTKGNQSRAARLLGVNHTTLNSKIKRYRLQEGEREFYLSREEHETVA